MLPAAGLIDFLLERFEFGQRLQVSALDFDAHLGNLH
jgi:hypothetical protein